MTHQLAATGDKSNYDQAAKAVRDAGGQLLQEKHAVPGVGWFSYCKDTEGNVFGIMQADDQAK